NPTSVKMPAITYPKPSAESNTVARPPHAKDPILKKNPFSIPGPTRVAIDPQLNPAYTLENVVEGESNRVARSAGLRVAQKPGTTAFNPLVVFGGVGCGKTHLAQAIGNEVRQQHPNKSVLYVSAEKFINQFIDHSRN